MNRTTSGGTALRRVAARAMVLVALVAAGIFLAGQEAGGSIILVGYNFDASSKGPTSPAVANLTTSNFDSSDGSTTWVNGNPATGKAIQDKGGWQSGTNYFTFNVTPAAGYRVVLANLTFDDSGEAANWQVSYQLGSGSFTNDGSGSAHANFTTPSPMNTANLSSLSSSQVTTFRITATGADNNGNKVWRVDNVTLNGDTQALASLSSSVTTNPAASKVLTGTSGLQYVLTTTNNAASGGTIDAQTLDYTLGFSSQTGLSFATSSGTGIARGASNTNTINVDTSTSGAKGGTVNVSSTNAYQQSLPGALQTVNVYQPASLTVTGGGTIQAANANTTDGGQRAAAKLTSLTKTSGDPDLSLTGLTAGSTVIAMNSTATGTPTVASNLLNGTYSASYALGFEHNDQTIVGTSASDLGTFNATVSTTITGNSGNQNANLGQGRGLGGLGGKSNKGKGSNAKFLDGALSSARNVSTGWRDAVAGEGPGGSDLLSDIVSLGGTSTDMYALQVSYSGTPSVPPFLAWWDGSEWVNAVAGNSGGTAHFVGDVAYDPNQHFSLGNYGVYTADGVAWAVINHDSDFAVAVPEPATMGLLGLGLLGLMLRRSRGRGA